MGKKLNERIVSVSSFGYLCLHMEYKCKTRRKTSQLIILFSTLQQEYSIVPGILQLFAVQYYILFPVIIRLVVHRSTVSFCFLLRSYRLGSSSLLVLILLLHCLYSSDSLKKNLSR